MPEQLIESVRDRNDLISVVSEHVSLKRSGQNYSGLCPFHSEKTPSFTVSPGKQIFHCFGCGAGGNIYTFLMKIEGLSFPEALERLAEKAGIALPKREKRVEDDSVRREIDQIYRLNEEAAAYFHQNLEKPEAARALAYLKERGITRATIEKFSIGFALARRDDLLKNFGAKYPLALLEKAGLISRKGGGEADPSDASPFDRFRNRVIFPIRTLQGKVVGFGGRVMDDAQPKYLNSPETPVYTKGKHLFGLDRTFGFRPLDQAKGKGGIRSLIIVEGYFDAIAAHQAGVPNVVATLGTALTQDHLQLIRRVAERVTLIFDPDDAGIRAALRTAPLFIEKGIPAEVVSLPRGEDPDLFIRRNGKEPFLQRVAAGEPLIDFAITQLAQASPSKSIDDRMKIIREVFPLIELLKNKIEQGHYLKRLAEELGVEERALRIDFARQAGKKGGGPSIPKTDAPAPKGSPPLAKDEETIATLLIQGRLDPLSLRDQLRLEDFASPQIRDILTPLWDGRENALAAPLSFDAQEETAALWRRLSLHKIDVEIEDVQKTAKDCVSSLRAKRLQREKAEVQKRLKLAEKGGDLPLVQSLQQKFFDLKKELSHLTLSR